MHANVKKLDSASAFWSLRL